MRLILIPVFLIVTGCIFGDEEEDFGVEDDGICDNDGAAAFDHIDVAISQNLSCEIAEDCVEVQTSTNCQGACPVYVSIEGATTVEDAISEADALYCPEVGGDCAYATPGCQALPPACVDGMCIADESGVE